MCSGKKFSKFIEILQTCGNHSLGLEKIVPEQFSRTSRCCDLTFVLDASRCTSGPPAQVHPFLGIVSPFIEKRAVTPCQVDPS